MKNQLRLVLTLAGVALLVTPLVNAQSEAKPPAGERGPGGPGRGRGPNVEMMIEQLELNADQAAKVREIFKQRQAKMEALAPEERREKGRAIREETDKQVEAVLTDAQKKKWQEMRANAPRGPRDGGQGGEGRRERPKTGA